jgi:hypothetical protein
LFLFFCVTPLSDTNGEGYKRVVDAKVF